MYGVLYTLLLLSMPVCEVIALHSSRQCLNAVAVAITARTAHDCVAKAISSEAYHYYVSTVS
jgi:hypothetical protein